MPITTVPTISVHGAGTGASSLDRMQFNAFAVTTNDATDLPQGTCDGLQVTGAGNVNVNLEGGGTAVLTGLSAGQIVRGAFTRVLTTSTTATGISALYRA